jgi:hypothetical protein
MTRQSIQAVGIVQTRITVRRQSERLFFDLFIPEKAEAFTSITAVASEMQDAALFYGARPWQDGTAGHLALRWNKPGDVFLMKSVDLLETFERDYAPLGLVHPGGAFWKDAGLPVGGRRIAPLAIKIPWDCRHVRGAYLDETCKARQKDIPYDVDIHLTFTQFK